MQGYSIYIRVVPKQKREDPSEKKHQYILLIVSFHIHQQTLKYEGQVEG